jgi:hypothetical protein
MVEIILVTQLCGMRFVRMAHCFRGRLSRSEHSSCAVSLELKGEGSLARR